MEETLLFGRKLPQTNVQPFGTEINLSKGTKRANYIDTVVEHHWERWRKEYVMSLRNWKEKYK